MEQHPRGAIENEQQDRGNKEYMCFSYVIFNNLFNFCFAFIKLMD